jgi:hypothetical protein
VLRIHGNHRAFTEPLVRFEGETEDNVATNPLSSGGLSPSGGSAPARCENPGSNAVRCGKPSPETVPPAGGEGTVAVLCRDVRAAHGLLRSRPARGAPALWPRIVFSITAR